MCGDHHLIPGYRVWLLRGAIQGAAHARVPQGWNHYPTVGVFGKVSPERIVSVLYASGLRN